MKAESTPLFNNGETNARLLASIPSDTEGEFLDVYEEPMQLPEGKKSSTCDKHIANGLCSDMIGDFWLQGCDFPRAEEEGLIRIEFSCIGPSALKRRCRMKLTQYDVNGNILNTGAVK